MKISSCPNSFFGMHKWQSWAQSEQFQDDGTWRPILKRTCIKCGECEWHFNDIPRTSAYLQARGVRLPVPSVKQELKDMTTPKEDFGEVDDGYGASWPKCRKACGLQVVRPGKVQCWCDESSVDDYILYLEKTIEEYG